MWSIFLKAWDSRIFPKSWRSEWRRCPPFKTGSPIQLVGPGQYDDTYRCPLDAIYILPHSIFVDSLIPSLHQVLLLLIPFLKSCLLPVFSLPPVFVIKDWFSCDNLVVFIVLISFRKWLVPMVQYRSMILTKILPLLARRQQFDNFTHLEFKLVIKAYKRSIV